MIDSGQDIFELVNGLFRMPESTAENWVSMHFGEGVDIQKNYLDDRSLSDLVIPNISRENDIRIGSVPYSFEMVMIVFDPNELIYKLMFKRSGGQPGLFDSLYEQLLEELGEPYDYYYGDPNSSWDADYYHWPFHEGLELELCETFGVDNETPEIWIGICYV